MSRAGSGCGKVWQCCRMRSPGGRGACCRADSGGEGEAVGQGGKVKPQGPSQAGARGPQGQDRGEGAEAQGLGATLRGGRPRKVDAWGGVGEWRRRWMVELAVEDR